MRKFFFLIFPHRWEGFPSETAQCRLRKSCRNIPSLSMLLKQASPAFRYHLFTGTWITPFETAPPFPLLNPPYPPVFPPYHISYYVIIKSVVYSVLPHYNKTPIGRQVPQTNPPLKGWKQCIKRIENSCIKRTENSAGT